MTGDDQSPANLASKGLRTLIGTSPFEDTPDANVPVVGVVDEDANSGLETLEWLTPLAAAACAHLAIRPRVLPGTGLIISEQYVVVDAVSRRIVLPFLDVEEAIEFR